MTVKNIYAGKPDARDEIIFDGYDSFINSFVVPPNFNTNDLLEENKCFIRGYKGTGKTALLIYLQELLLRKDASAFTSFLLFKEQYTATQRRELTSISSKLVRAIDASEAVSGENDFEYIWRWIILKQIVEDNEFCSYGLFKRDSAWDHFSGIVKSILSDAGDKKMFKIPKKIKLGVDYSLDGIGNPTFTPNIELNFESKEDIRAYSLFTQNIDIAINLLSRMERSDIPYFTFIDELEAYYSDRELLERDLQLIRDLIITVKYFNQLFTTNNFKKTKIIASVRTEIINSIGLFVPGKEINKTISGFDCPVLWDYNTTNTYAHPIMHIWLKRIQISSSIDNEKSFLELYNKWFPEKIDGIEPANYILNNSWTKPRDVVRFITASQNCLESSQDTYTRAVFVASMKEYSIESRKEIVEELNSLYTAEEIGLIFSCLRGYKSTFTFDEIEGRIERYYPSTFLNIKTLQVIQDLYRLGVLGNYSKYSKQFRWQHKGDDGVLFTDDWKLFVHRALQKDLSINTKRDRSFKHFQENEPLISASKSIPFKSQVTFTVNGIIEHFVIGTFNYQGNIYQGAVHISKIANTYIKDIHDFLSIGEVLEATVLEKNNKFNSWNLSLLE